MLLDLLNQEYPSKSLDQNQSTLINMYLEPDPKGKYKLIALPTPGLTLFCNSEGSQVRELYNLNETAYAVIDNHFCSISSIGSVTNLGTLNTSSGWAKIKAITGASDINHQILIADGTNLYQYNITSGVFQTLTTNTSISQIIMSTPGSGYLQPPTVSFTDSTGSGATATAAINVGGEVVGVTITNGGTNYTSPSVVFTPVSGGTGAAATAITAYSNPPSTTIDIENQDDYFFAANSSSMQYNISNLADGTSWDALNFASKYGQPDNIQAIMSHEGMIWLMGNKTSEIWYNAGVDISTNQFPFTRNTNTFLHYGVAAKQSIAVNGNYFVFLGANRGGGYSVFQTLPRIYYYNPAAISTPPIDTLISGYSTVGDANGAIVNYNGHEFYYLTFPTANSTLVYDIPKTEQADQQKGSWHLETSYVNGSYGRTLRNCQAFCYGKQLIGDYSSGKVYYLDGNNYTENNTPIQRTFVSSPQQTYQGGNRVYFHNLQIDVETGIGSNKTFTLEKSTDNGNTWNLINTYTVPSKGYRIKEPMVGSSRFGMLFRIKTTMNANFCLLGFQVEAAVGHS